MRPDSLATPSQRRPRWPNLPCVWTLAVLLAHTLRFDSLPSSPAHTDKLVHLVMFASLGPVALACRWSTRAYLALATTVALVAESMQAALPWRSMSGLDWLFDAFGIAIGALVVRSNVGLGRNGWDSNPR